MGLEYLFCSSCSAFMVGLLFGQGMVRGGQGGGQGKNPDKHWPGQGGQGKSLLKRKKFIKLFYVRVRVRHAYVRVMRAHMSRVYA